MPSLATLGNELHDGTRSFDIVGRRRLWFTIAIASMVICLGLLGIRGLNLGIEFRGGSQFTISGTENLEQQVAIDAVLEVGSDQIVRVSQVGASALRVQTQELDSEQTDEVRAALAEAYEVPLQDVTATFIGPSWGADITRQAIIGLGIFLVLVSAVLWVYFRSWQMALAALAALIHDLVITIGAYALLGWEVTPATVIGLLTVLSYSLYDTVVVFDKVRENSDELVEQHERTYAELANLAVNQTLVRSINTSMTTLLPVGSILFVGALLLGAGTLRDIALALFIGLLVSTVSSVFIATPVQVALHEREESIKDHAAEVRARRERVHGSAGTGTVPTANPGGHRGQSALPKRRRKGRR